MSGIDTRSLLLYSAVAVALLLIGARWIRAAEPEREPGQGLSFPLRAAPGAAAAPGGEDVVVHVAGAVRKPGVYRLPLGARVTDAIARAGGSAAGAATDAINLAARLADGQQVVVPARAAAGAMDGAGPSDGPISLGSASAAELETIEGIGPVTAAAIIGFRDSNGGIGSIDDLDQVTGIGPATLEVLRDRLQP